MSRLYEPQSIFTAHKRRLQSGEHPLIANGLIENTSGGIFNNRESFKLTDKVKKEMLADLKIKVSQKSKDIIQAKSIQEKKLFYNESEAEQVNRFSSLLGIDSFKDIQARLLENKMRAGFACLFYGSPGCGMMKIKDLRMGMTPKEHNYKTLLFDLLQDPKQLKPINNDMIENKMIEHLRRIMKENDTPDEQFVRVGI
jgi:hypothetical protein